MKTCRADLSAIVREQGTKEEGRSASAVESLGERLKAQKRKPNRSPEILRGEMDQPSREAMAGKLQIYC